MKQTNYIDILDKSFRTQANQFTKCYWNALASFPPCTPTTLSACTTQPHPQEKLTDVPPGIAKAEDPIKTQGTQFAW